VEYLIVAGGGGGGKGNGGGGGGAGGLLQGFAGIVTGSSYFVTVGSGGTGSLSSFGANGTNSVFDATSSGASTGRIVVTGGGGGGGSDSANYLGVSGASGGGGGTRVANNTSPGASGISGQGNSSGGGISNGSTYRNGGGGGGAGTVGLDANANTGGTGGAGIASDITGTRVVYGGGGGGGSYNSGTGVAGIGGVGGGGAGGTIAISGTANTGGGGGGVSWDNSPTAGNGGSGIVVIRYPGNVQYFTGGTLNYSNGFIVHTFYASGTLAPTTPRLFASPDYQIQRSIRFNSPDAVLLERAGSAGGNRKTWTWSGWIKRSKLNSSNTNVPFLFGASDRATGSAYLQFGTYGSDSAVDCLSFQEQSGGTYKTTTQAKFRDTSAWYHVVCAYDTTQATASDRIKIYINGILQTITSDSTYPPQNNDGYVNYSAYPYLIGAYDTGSTLYTFGGYIAEINFVDGQQLTPSSFGYTEPTTGVWTPLQYVGSYGTRGFYLNFADNSNTTAATLGKDLSGNANNFTPYNFSVTAGVGNDSFVDSPTNYGVDTGVGGEIRGNYCTWNPVDTTSTAYISNGNLTNSSGANNYPIRGTIGFSSGKWYWEWTEEATPNNHIGVWGTSSLTAGTYNYVGEAADSWGLSTSNGNKRNNGSNTAYGSVYANGDVGMCAVDMDNGKIWWGKNGTWFASGSPSAGTNAAFTNLTGTLRPAQIQYSAGSFNFGQRAFAYAAPTGYNALCTQNLPESTAGKLPGKYFGVATYTGNGSTNAVGPFGFQPDLAWTKSRSATGFNILRDSVRGSTKRLISDGTYDELDDATYGTFTYNGLSLGSNVNHNTSGTTYVAWAWAAGGTTVTNTAGSISAQVRANPTSGFSIVTYTGTGANATIGHGLGIAPSMILQKNKTGYNWRVYHASAGNTNELYLDLTTAATATSAAWNNTTPTTTVFSVGSGSAVNGGGFACVAYCWAEVAGYSRFGSYVGNGSADGPFVYCGFRPRYVMYKCSSATGNWITIDTARDLYNVSSTRLLANTNDSEASGTHTIDILSNGFKLRNTDTNGNASATTYIFAAYAESPFKYARAR
jgi:hypothetical protein